MNRRIKPLKKVTITSAEYTGAYEEEHKVILRQAKKYQIKNPKWASLYHDACVDWEYIMIKPLKKCKSLQLTSIVFDGRQTGASVGHFWGDIKHLDRSSRHLKKLHMGAGAAGKERLRDFKKFLLRRNSLTDLLLVPYWFPLPNQDGDESDIEDWDEEACRIDGAPRMIHLMGGQIEKLGTFGFTREDFVNSLNMNLMKGLKHFTIKAAFRPEGCDGEPDQFEEIHLGLIEKILKTENIRILTLYGQCDTTEKEFWVSLKDLIVNIKRPLIVDVKIDYRYSNMRTNEWFKKIFKRLPANIKVTYSIKDMGYFLSMPQGIEVLGEDDGNDDDCDEESEDDGDDENENEDENNEENDNEDKDEEEEEDEDDE